MRSSAGQELGFRSSHRTHREEGEPRAAGLLGEYGLVYYPKVDMHV
jgi:hypothetical protein